MKIRIKKITAFCFFVMSLAFFVAGCSANKEVIKFEKLEDAGSSHIAVLSTAPWEKYSEEIMPSFEIDSKKALEQVMPTTGTIESRLFDSVEGGISLAFPATTGTTEKKGDNKSEAKPGEADKNAGKNPDIASLKALLELKPDVDPMLRYLAATALYQEVKLLNKYIEDAACDNSDAYLVRLQVSIMPKARKVPYDFYISFSFFPKNDKRATIEEHLRVIPLLVTDNLEGILHTKGTDRVRQIAAYLSLMYEGFGLGANLQNKHEEIENLFGKDINSLMTVSRISDNTMRVRIGALKQVGQAGSDYSMIPRTHNITFLLVVPKSDGNKDIRLISKSSMVNAIDGTELRPRNEQERYEIFDKIFTFNSKEFYDISKLESTDDIEENKNLSAKDKEGIKDNRKKIQDILVFCRAEKYKKYSNNNLEKCFKNVGESKKNIEEHKQKLYDVLQSLNDYIDENKWYEFNKAASDIFDYPDQAWVDFTSLLNVGSQWNITDFKLNDKPSPSLVEEQTLLLQDDGENNSIILLQGENLSSKHLMATLYMQKAEVTESNKNDTKENEGKKKDIKTAKKQKQATIGAKEDEGINKIQTLDKPKEEDRYPFVPQTIEILSKGRIAKLVFPSMKAFGLGKGNNTLEVKNIEDKKFRVLYLEKAKAKKGPGFSIKVNTEFITANKEGKGTLQLIVKMDPEKPSKVIFFEITGAELENIVSNSEKIQEPKEKTEWFATKAGIVNLSLGNLSDKAVVVIKARNQDKDEHEQIRKLVVKEK